MKIWSVAQQLTRYIFFFGSLRSFAHFLFLLRYARRNYVLYALLMCVYVCTSRYVWCGDGVSLFTFCYLIKWYDIFGFIRLSYMQLSHRLPTTKHTFANIIISDAIDCCARLPIFFCSLIRWNSSQLWIFVIFRSDFSVDNNFSSASFFCSICDFFSFFVSFVCRLFRSFKNKREHFECFMCVCLLKSLWRRFCSLWHIAGSLFFFSFVPINFAIATWKRFTVCDVTHVRETRGACTWISCSSIFLYHLQTYIFKSEDLLPLSEDPLDDETSVCYCVALVNERTNERT